MDERIRRTKIVATLGPASSSDAVLRQLITAGLDVARLNFSHGTHEEKRELLARLRSAARELGRPVTILQDLQGPKVRVGNLPGGQVALQAGEQVALMPEADFSGQAHTIPIDYPHAAEEAVPGMRVLMADGLFELQFLAVDGQNLICQVLEGGVLKSRKGVNFPGLNLRLPSLTEKDLNDLAFGLEQDVDWISLSFVRNAADVRELKEVIARSGKAKPVIAKIEKPQALEHLDAIIAEVQGIMVARGDLGVELSPERVPMVQKQIIERCNRLGKPVITATQMLESMIQEPFPTRAEASDVANAIIDGTDAVMLSGESAVGAHPVRAVEMMARIAREVEASITFRSYPPPASTVPHALSRAANIIEELIEPACIVLLTISGHTARTVAAERPKSPVVALTHNQRVYHALNLLWGIRPVLTSAKPDTAEELVDLAEQVVRAERLAQPGQTIMVLAGVPAHAALGTNFLKIHTLKP